MRIDRVVLALLLGTLLAGCSAPSPAPAASAANATAPHADTPASVPAPASTQNTTTADTIPLIAASETTSKPQSAPGAHQAVSAPLMSVKPSNAAMPASVTTKPLDGDGNAKGLPEDVQAFIIKRRMCKHLSAASTSDADGAKLAMRICPGADAAEWKVLVKKYQVRDEITGVLLAERPPGIEALK